MAERPTPTGVSWAVRWQRHLGQSDGSGQANAGQYRSIYQQRALRTQGRRQTAYPQMPYRRDADTQDP